MSEIPPCTDAMETVTEAYPDHDFPWTHYFNGEPLPRWSNCWHLVPMHSYAEEYMNRWEGDLVGYQRLWRLGCRMDHLGVESEDPEVFRLCCLTLCYVLLRHKAEILKELEADGPRYGATPLEIFTGVRGGLFAMYRRCLADGIAFWASGYEADRDALREAMRRSRLQPSDPDWLEPPHLWRQRLDAQFRRSQIRSDILSLLGTRVYSKEVRRLIHELPKKP
ncbi:MAG: hypothetical protein JWO89_3499 [Verrucomicrobiaceae bacterium]|nr:hypothetical protein [Verrucomicrobiaceae bacterium]